jgi:hypothetical protein
MTNSNKQGVLEYGTKLKEWTNALHLVKLMHFWHQLEDKMLHHNLVLVIGG